MKVLSGTMRSRIYTTAGRLPQSVIIRSHEILSTSQSFKHTNRPDRGKFMRIEALSATDKQVSHGTKYPLQYSPKPPSYEDNIHIPATFEKDVKRRILARAKILIKQDGERIHPHPGPNQEGPRIISKNINGLNSDNQERFRKLLNYICIENKKDPILAVLLQEHNLLNIPLDLNPDCKTTNEQREKVAFSHYNIIWIENNSKNHNVKFETRKINIFNSKLSFLKRQSFR